MNEIDECITRLTQILYNLYPSLVNFPRWERQCLVNNIINTISKAITNLNLANKVKSKRIYYLSKSEGYIENLKVLLKIATNQKYISKGLFKNIDLQLTSVTNSLSLAFKSGKQ